MKDSDSKEPVRALAALLVDVDGTLVLSNAAHASAWARALQLHGFDVPTDVIRPRIGMGADKDLRGLHHNLDETSPVAAAIAKDRKRLFMEEYLPGILPAPGAKLLLAALHDAGVRIAVASSAEGDERAALLAVAQVDHLVEPPPPPPQNSKPDPDAVIAALAQTGVAAADACMLGDTPYDVDAAAAADVRTVAVKCGGWDERSLAQAWAIFADPAEALQRLAQWAGIEPPALVRPA